MADNDYSIIKPVEGLQNIGGITPIQRREERKKKKQHGQNEGEQESDKEELKELGEEKLRGEPDDNEQDQHSIDYCA